MISSPSSSSHFNEKEESEGVNMPDSRPIKAEGIFCFIELFDSV